MRCFTFHLFILLSLSFSSLYSADTTEIKPDRHPLISVGVGIQDGESLDPGLVYTAGFEYPLNRGRYANLELLFWNWYGKVTSEFPEAKGIEHSGYGVSLLGRFFFVSDSSAFRPFFHIGGAPWPFVSWDIGAGADYQFYHDFYLQFCARYTTTIFQGLTQPSSGKYFPAMATVSLRYKL